MEEADNMVFHRDHRRTPPSGVLLATSYIRQSDPPEVLTIGGYSRGTQGKVLCMMVGQGKRKGEMRGGRREKRGGKREGEENWET